MSVDGLVITQEMKKHLGVYFAAAKSTTDPHSILLNTRNAFDLALACYTIDNMAGYDAEFQNCEKTLGNIFMMDTNEPENKRKIVWFCSEVLKVITPLVYKYAMFDPSQVLMRKDGMK